MNVQESVNSILGLKRQLFKNRDITGKNALAWHDQAGLVNGVYSIDKGANIGLAWA